MIYQYGLTSHLLHKYKHFDNIKCLSEENKEIVIKRLSKYSKCTIGGFIWSFSKDKPSPILRNSELISIYRNGSLVAVSKNTKDASMVTGVPQSKIIRYTPAKAINGYSFISYKDMKKGFKKLDPYK